LKTILHFRNFSRLPLLVLLLTIVQSCQYPPFLNYYLPSKKTHLPTFSKWEKTIGSNSNPIRSCYDVTSYDWTVHVHPEQKTINAQMKINFKMVFNQDSLLLDLQRHLCIDKITSSIPLKKSKQKKDAIFIVFERELKKGETAWLEISYHGKPVKMLSYTAINWGKDINNNPWICTATEGVGPHHMMPCKNLLSDEPDSCFIRIGVPKELVAVSNGKLDSISETQTEKIYHWAVRNPINIYSLSFNVGNYVKLEKTYQDIYNVDRTIQIYALNYNKEIADTFYNQAPIILQKLEQLYGSYPWWKDECKIIETNLPHGLCMEHQSAISMTDAYHNQYKNINYTLVHELSHEWWGNSVTAYDYADLWLHEGFATYTEVLLLEQFLGKESYANAIYYFSNLVINKRPLLKPADVRYNNLVHDDDQDIYNKGALFLHTLRRQLDNDELFFTILKETQLRFSKSSITSEQFLSYFNAETKRDFTAFFDVYLQQIKPPTLAFHIDKSHSDSVTVEYKWNEELPANFHMKVILIVGDQAMNLFPTSNIQRVRFPKDQRFVFDSATFGYILFKESKDFLKSTF